MKKAYLMALAVAMALVGCQNTTTQENKEDEKKVEMTETFESADALFQAIGESIYAKQDPQKSIKMVDRLLTDYPDYESNPVALFMLASFVYDEQLQDYDKARETYQRIIDNYPDSPFAKDAALAIPQLGIPLDELIKSFEEASLSADAGSVEGDK